MNTQVDERLEQVEALEGLINNMPPEHTRTTEAKVYLTALRDLMKLDEEEVSEIALFVMALLHLFVVNPLLCDKLAGVSLKGLYQAIMKEGER